MELRADAPEFTPAELGKAGGGVSAADDAPALEPDVLQEQGNPSIRTGRWEAEQLSESILTNRGALGKSRRKTFGQYWQSGNAI